MGAPNLLLAPATSNLVTPLYSCMVLVHEPLCRPIYMYDVLCALNVTVTSFYLPMFETCARRYLFYVIY